MTSRLRNWLGTAPKPALRDPEFRGPRAEGRNQAAARSPNAAIGSRPSGFFRVSALILPLLLWLPRPAFGTGETNSLVMLPWYESRTAHFHTYSCGPQREVAKLTARLEQFQDAYAMLAGAQAVSSPPVVVMAYPNHAAMEPFLPLYHGRPANLDAFFLRGSDENLIVLCLLADGTPSMATVYHEYAHLLLRHNQQFWPVWLNEGMAEVYSTFEVAGNSGVRIGTPIQHHLRVLAHSPLWTLLTLFKVTHDSPEYNEDEHQGVFYAESWLLTHYLMLGPNPARRARFGLLTTLLRQGQSPVQAFTNAFQTTLPAMESELRAYLAAGRFAPAEFNTGADLSGAQLMTTRMLAPVETCLRLGDQLMRIRRLDQAEAYFDQAKKLAPASPFPYEGLGLLAAEREQPEAAVRWLREALQRGSTSYLAHYTYAMEKYRATSSSPGSYAPVAKELAAEIRAELIRSVVLMPSFGPGHHLLGFFEMVQRENLAQAEQHLAEAIRLEPENASYLLSLAQVQMARKDLPAARRTLDSLRLPYVDSNLRDAALRLIEKLGR